MQLWCKKCKMAVKILIKPSNIAITSEISQLLFLAMFAITSDNIITALNNDTMKNVARNASLKTIALTVHTRTNLEVTK